MLRWSFTEKNVKRYGHFDSPISAENLRALATDEKRVAKHSFYPFLRFTKKWNKFAPLSNAGEVKSRELRYAARRDACIYSRYRYLLSVEYEKLVSARSLGGSVIAYRRIVAAAGGGKCNIDFARDAFEAIKSAGNSLVIASDISGFFENIDHALLKDRWCELLGVSRLPPDHFAVYTAITKYSIVDRRQCLKALGHIIDIKDPVSGRPREKFVTRKSDLSKIQQLCSPSEFRQKISGLKLIQRHYKPYGIPQGSPLSDLLANISLIKFDEEMNKLVKPFNGTYMRYSDDIIVILPNFCGEWRPLFASMQASLKAAGERLEMKQKKTSVMQYTTVTPGRQVFSLLDGEQGLNGLEYLGFRYDGEKVFFRDATISGLLRKIVKAVRRSAWATATRYPDKSTEEIVLLMNKEVISKKFGKVEDFFDKQDRYKCWTFWTYAVRSIARFGQDGHALRRQLRNISDFIDRRMLEEAGRAVAKRR